MHNNSSSSTPLACQCEKGAFSAEQQARYRTIRQQLGMAIEGSQELPDGYALRFPSQNSLVLTLAEFITLERLCCGFFRFTLEVEPEAGPLWLRLTGPDGVKELLRGELGLTHG